MKEKHYFFDTAKAAAEHDLHEMAVRESALSEEDRAYLSAAKRKEAEGLIHKHGRVKDDGKEREFEKAHEKAVEFAREMSWNIEVESAGGIGSITFSAEEIVFVAAVDSAAYETLLDIMGTADLVALMPDRNHANRVQLYLYYTLWRYL